MFRRCLIFLGVVLPVVCADVRSLAYDNVSVEEAKTMIDSNSGLIIVDVREYETEFCSAGGHIPGAVNYPWNSGVLQQRFNELPQTADILLV